MKTKLLTLVVLAIVGVTGAALISPKLSGAIRAALVKAARSQATTPQPF